MFKLNGVPLKARRFPDETPFFDISDESEKLTLEWLYEKDEEILLYFIVKHLKAQSRTKCLTLYMPYIPHARMDRVKSETEVFTLKYFCEFINSLNIDKIIVRDPHSAVSAALLNNLVQEPICNTVKALAEKLLCKENDIVFYPDEGSSKRYSDMIKFPYAFGIKNRDWSTGEIKGLDVRGEIPQNPFNVLIIDDISSYGGTFLHAARKLKALSANKIYLYITHCENSILSGELIKSNLIEKIYTTKSIYTAQHDLIECVEII